MMPSSILYCIYTINSNIACCKWLMSDSCKYAGNHRFTQKEVTTATQSLANLFRSYRITIVILHIAPFSYWRSVWVYRDVLRGGGSENCVWHLAYVLFKSVTCHVFALCSEAFGSTPSGAETAIGWCHNKRKRRKQKCPNKNQGFRDPVTAWQLTPNSIVMIMTTL